jgi:hypothetical protein
MKALALFALGATLTLSASSRSGEAQPSASMPGNLVFAAQAQQPPQQQQLKVGPNNMIYWKLDKLSPNLAQGISWVRTRVYNIFMARKISVPYLEVTVQDQTGTEVSYPISLDPKTAQLSSGDIHTLILNLRCHIGRRFELKYAPVEVKDQAGKKLFSIEVQQALSLYWPNSIAPPPPPGPIPIPVPVPAIPCQLLEIPEFYPEIEYNYKGDLPLKKVKVRMRMDFDVEGPGNDVAIMVRDPLTPWICTSLAPKLFGDHANPLGGTTDCHPEEFMRKLSQN